MMRRVPPVGTRLTENAGAAPNAIERHVPGSLFGSCSSSGGHATTHRSTERCFRTYDGALVARRMGLAPLLPPPPLCAYHSHAPWRDTRASMSVAAPSTASSRRIPEAPLLTAHLKNAQSAGDLLRLYEAHGDRFNGIHAAAFWQSYGQFAESTVYFSLEHQRPAVPLCAETARLLPEMNEQALVSAARGAARVLAAINSSSYAGEHGGGVGGGGHGGGAAAAAAAAASGGGGGGRAGVAGGAAAGGVLSDGDVGVDIARSDKSDPSLATAETAAEQATLEMGLRWFFQRLEVHTLRLLPSLSTRGLTSLAWGFSKAHCGSAELYDKLCAHMMPRVRDFSSSDVATAAWAMAVVGHTDTDLFRAMADRASDTIGAFSPQSLANTLWAFGKVGHYAPQLFSAASEHFGFVNGQLKPQEMSNVLWAYATVGHSDTRLFNTAAAITTTRAHTLTPQALANTAWACAKAHFCPPALFDALAKQTSARIAEFKPKELANLTWAFASTRLADPALFSLIDDAASTRVDEFKFVELLMLGRSFAKACHVSEVIFCMIEDQAEAVIPELEAQALANLAWMFAVVDRRCPALFSPSFARACEDANFDDTSLRMLHQFSLWCDEISEPCLLSSDLLRACSEAFSDKVDVTTSYNHMQVAETLVSMGYDVEIEKVSNCGYSIDIVAAAGEDQVWLEIDGPTHYLGSSYVPTGSTSLKRRQLLRLGGQELVVIPYWEWSGLGLNAEHRKSYLSHKLSDRLYWYFQAQEMDGSY